MEHFNHQFNKYWHYWAFRNDIIYP